MKFYFVLVLISCTSTAFAFEWRVNEYVDNCSVVRLKTITEEDDEVVGYCMGVLKGAFAGVVVTESLETGVLITPGCNSVNDKTSFRDIQKMYWLPCV